MANEIENDPVYQLARQAGRNDAAAIRNNFQNAQLVNPDQDAKNQSLARMMRIPTDAVRDFPQDVEKQAASQSLDVLKLMSETPSLANMLRNQDKANIAHDDLSNLSELERNIRLYGELKAPTGPAASFSSIAMGLLKALPQGLEATRQGINRQWADLWGNEQMIKEAERKSARVESDIFYSTPEFESSTARGLYGGGVSLLRQAPGVTAAILLRNPTLALAGAGVQTEAEAYSKYRNRGGGKGESLVGALGEGATEVATEMMPMGFLVNKLGKVGAGEFLKGFLGRELAGEELATLVQDAIDTAVANPDKTWGDYLAERPEAAYETALATLVQSGVMTGVHGVASRLGHREREAQGAQEKAQLLETINQYAEASKLRGRDATTTRDYLQSIMDEGKDAVFITPNALAQSGMADKLAAAIPEVADQLQSASVTGHDIRIPIADLMAKLPGEELKTTIIPHVSDEPGGFTLVSSQEFMQSGKAQELQNEVQRVLTDKLGDDTFKQSQQTVKQVVLDELNKAGRFSPEKNEIDATLVAARSAVRAAQLGITPEQFFAKYMLKAHAEALGGQHYDQDGQLITDTANFQNWFKESKTVDAQGKPMQMYHGTAQNIHQFRAKQAGAIFVTDDPKFAHGFSEMSSDWMVEHHEEILDDKQISAAKDAAESYIREEFASEPDKADLLVHEMRVGDRLTNTKAKTLFNKAISEQMPSGQNIIPVYVSAQNPFDYENPEHVAAVVAELNKSTNQWGKPRGESAKGFIERGNWEEIEKSVTQQAIKAAGFDGFYVKEGSKKNLAVYNPTQVKSVFNDGSFNPNNPNILNQAEVGGANAITGDLSRVNPAVRDAVESYIARKPEAEQARIRDNLEKQKSTAWAAAAVKGMAYREMLERAMEGRDTSDLEVNAIWGKQDMGASKIVKAFKLYPQLGEVAIRKLISAYDFVGGNRKAEHDISTSFANCNPSTECATHCYAAGSNARPNEIAKSEFTEFVMEKFPELVADEVAEAFGISEAGKAGLSLRLNDKGDLSEAQIQFVANMNARGIAMQVFSKRPELLRQLSDENLKMLSVDGSNMDLAYANPDLRLAVVITDEMTEDMLTPIHDRVSVYLPVNLKGKSITNEELKTRFPNLFKRMRSENLCPVDGGKLVTKPGTSFVDIRDRTAEKGTWTCTACDLYGNAGCFKGDRKTSQRKAQTLLLTDVKKELAIKKARIELQKQLNLLKTLGDIDGELYEQISGSLAARQPGVWADVDATRAYRDGAEEGSVPGQENQSGERAGSNAGPVISSGKTQSLNQSAPTFFSQLTRAVEGAKQTKAPASDWLSIISKLPGVKAEEIEWTGLKDYLTLLGKEQVTKQDISAYLKQNGVRVSEVELGELNDKQRFEEMQRKALEDFGLPYGELDHDQQADVEKYIDSDNSQYGDYVLEGGKEYRELLLTLPTRMSQEDAKRMAKLEFDRNTYTHKFIFDDSEEGKELKALQEKVKAQNYSSRHWEQENVLAHVRFNERIDVDGNRVLFIEELQSDWAQDGRKRGFGKVTRYEYEAVQENGQLVRSFRDKAEAEAFAAEKGLQLNEIPFTVDTGIPNAPFVGDTKGWLNLALKRMVRYAAEKGFDKVAFVNGQQSADRYDLSKQVESIGYDPQTRRLEAYDKNRKSVINRTGVATEDLEDYVGKEVAKRLLEQPLVMGKHLLDGEAIKVGGEGMIAFYDKIVPNAVSSLIKKMDGKLETVSFSHDPNPQLDTWEPEDGEGDGSKAPVEQYIQPGFTITDKMREMAMQGQPLFQGGGNRGSITFNVYEVKGSKDETIGYVQAESKEQAEQIASKDDNLKGYKSIADQPASLISMLSGADLSTVVHELGHYFLETDIQLASQIVAEGRAFGYDGLSQGEREILEDVSKLLTWHGINGPIEDQLDQWHTMDFEEKRSYHEKTAESFEKYLFEGKAPSIELQPYFQKLRAWMLQVYNSITKFLKANPDAGQLTDEVRQVFDRMLASTEQIKLAEQARSMMPLFSSAQQAGMTQDEFERYQREGLQASMDAVQELQARTLRDMQWLENAKAREIRRLQSQAAEKRREVKIEARREVMTQPVYRAWQFLTGKMSSEDKAAVTPPEQRKSVGGKVDNTVDSMFVAIAKLGGIDAESAQSQWGIDPKERSAQPIFGKPVIRKTNGHSVDSMGELLSSYGYLKLDENGHFDQAEFEEKYMAEYRGKPQYSMSHEYNGQDEARPGEGADLEQLGAGRFDLVALRETGIPQEILDHIINLKMTAKDGLHPDLVVDKFPEFESADELVRTLAAVPTPKDAIESLTDRMMLERYGDLATPEAIHEAADKAIHNAARARFVRTQYVAAAKAAGQPRMLDQAAKMFVAQMIDRLMLRNIKPGQYAAAEVRAAKAAEEAMKAGDTQQVAVETRNQLINVMATKAAYDAIAEFEQAKKFFAKVLGGKDAEMAKKRDMDIVNAARAVLAQFGYGGKAKSAVDYLASVKKYDEAMYNVLVQSVQSAEAMAKPLTELTLEELRGVRAEVESLWHLSARANQMEVDGRLLDRQDIIEALVSRMQTLGIPEDEPGTTSAITPQEEMALRLKQTLALGRRVESWVDQKDGFDKMGAFRRYIFQPIKDAADRYRADKVKYIGKFRDALATIAPAMKREVIAAPELNYTFGKDSGGVAMNEILHAILHTGNESNKRKLLLGRKWAMELPDGTVDTSRWDAFVARMIKEGKLTKAHYDFAQTVWDLLDSMKPAAQKAHRDAYGRYFEEITANEFVTPFGVYAGGYVPAKVDSRIVKDGELQKLIEEGKDGMAYAFPSTSKGFTKSRVEYNKPLMLDLRTFAQHIDQVLKFSHLENPTKDATRLLTNHDLSNPLNRMDGSAINNLLVPWLQRSASQLVTTPVSGYGWQMRMLNFIRNRTSMATMFANLSNTVQQLAGFMVAGVKVRPSSMMAATAQYMRSPKEMSEAVALMSSYMEHRMSDEMSAMMGEVEEILLNPNLYEKAQDWTKRHQFFLQSALDNVMGPIIWTAAYNEAVEDGHDDKDAARIADGVVRQTQGSSLPEDVSNIEVGNAFKRFFMQFAAYFNMQANLVGGELAKTAQEMGMRKGLGRGLYVFTTGFYASAVVAELVTQIFRGGPDDDDKDGEYLDDWLMALFVYGPLRNATAMLPGVGQVINSAASRFNDNPNDDRMSLAPAVSAIEAAASVPVDLYNHVVDNGKANLKKTVKDLGMLISLTTGLPAFAAARPISYLGGMSDDKIEPTDSADFIRGLITGTPSPESKVR